MKNEFQFYYAGASPAVLARALWSSNNWHARRVYLQNIGSGKRHLQRDICHAGLSWTNLCSFSLGLVLFCSYLSVMPLLLLRFFFQPPKQLRYAEFFHVCCFFISIINIWPALVSFPSRYNARGYLWQQLWDETVLISIVNLKFVLCKLRWRQRSIAFFSFFTRNLTFGSFYK